MNDNIIEFIEKQKCASICCVDAEGNPYCFSCFYAFNADEGQFYFKSSADTYHIKIILANPSVAGTILPDKLSLFTVKGIQFQGRVLSEENAEIYKPAIHYHKRHIVALAIPGEVWTIQISRIKMTDSSLGFGKKISWERNEVAVS